MGTNLKYNKEIKLIDEINLERSLLVVLAKEFFEFPQNLHNFILKDYNKENYITIEFFNYRKDSCSITYNFNFNKVHFKKGIGGIHYNELRLINKLIELKIWII